MSNVDASLASVLEADRALRAARDAFMAVGDDDARVAAIAQAVDKAFLDKDHEVESSAELVRLSELLFLIGSAGAAHGLVKILAHDEPGVRVTAGESLVEMLYDRYAEVARIFEAEIDRGGAPTALAEMAFILAEVGEPGGVKIIGKLLKHADATVVGAAVESLATLGDPAGIKLLEPLRNDKRTVALDDDDDGAGEVPLGELVEEAIEHLRKLRSA